MEPNKFDKSIKEKMEGRVIAPSDAAWDKLNAMLEVGDRPKRKYSWLYIAASFAGLLLVSSIFLFQEKLGRINTNSTNPVVIEQQSIQHSEKSKDVTKEPLSLQKANSGIIAIANKKEKSFHKKQLHHWKEKEVLVATTTKEEEKGYAVISAERKEAQSNSKNKYITGESLLAAVSNSNVVLTNSKIKPIINKTGTAVDPNILLSSVENELNASYRESAIDKISKKLNAIKSAVANRNYQE